MLGARDEALDDEAERCCVAIGAALDGPHPLRSPDEGARVVGANDAPTRGETARLHDHGIVEAGRERLRVRVLGQVPKRRMRQTDPLLQVAEGELVPQGAHGGQRVAGQVEAFRDQRRDLQTPIVDGEYGVESPVEIRERLLGCRVRFGEGKCQHRVDAPERGQLMAVIRGGDDLHAERAAGREEILVAVRGRRQQQEDAAHRAGSKAVNSERSRGPRTS